MPPLLLIDSTLVALPKKSNENGRSTSALASSARPSGVPLAAISMKRDAPLSS
ncbi:MAG: hypothetical protein ABW187_06130 [Dokdonella sp.]